MERSPTQLYTRSAKVSANNSTGYAKNNRILRDGVVWLSLVDNNLVPPGDTGAWDMDPSGT